ncbi:prolyl 3-hydroxylase 1-like isoform X2 [Anneissia japonica]|uniref:prolyl 3-hydroxylase 1-like isoform X2 n=1 Tax=Anneissia japonica TaxID=1529436 RepID=UPI001425629A|nr:prolyl 3-hydroxylase 1-like isoform X2 [Anneissia japonica]
MVNKSTRDTVHCGPRTILSVGLGIVCLKIIGIIVQRVGQQTQMRRVGHCLQIIMAQFISSVSIFCTVIISYYMATPGSTELRSFLASEKTYDELYQEGMKAYSSENWKDTITFLENAITEFKFYRNQLTSCRIKCNNVSKVSFPNSNELTELTFFESVFFQADCLRRCKFQNLGNRPETLNQEVTEKFLGKIPYSYLQFAYYKNFQYSSAISAAYTYLQANPQDEVMISNLEYYESISSNKDSFVDLEEEPHQAHFRRGLKYYRTQNWTGVIYEMEEALSAYWIADLECRALCEGKYDDRDFLDLYEAISNHYASTLHCKEGCEAVLATLEEENYENYLPQHFHFLQFAYFQVEDITHATQNALSFLLFSPDDEIMKSNMRYYLNEGIDAEDIRPREDAERYHSRVMMEKKMLAFARLRFWGEDDVVYNDPLEKPSVTEYMDEDDNNKEIEELIQRGKELEKLKDKYKFNDEEDESDEYVETDDTHERSNNDDDNIEDKEKNLDEEKPNTSDEETDVNDVADKSITDNGHFLDERPAPPTEVERDDQRTTSNNIKEDKDKNDAVIIPESEKTKSSRKKKQVRKAVALLDGMKITRDEASLRGKNRVVADKLTSQDECKLLLDLAQTYAYPGDGYQGNLHPHSSHESFKGIDILEVVLFARAKKIPHAMAQAYLDLSERARMFTESYFNLTRPLYHSYTHLVCRTTEPGAPVDRKDLSHPVHADNCQLDENGDCHKVPPAFVWRDWSAITYLGDDFEGGDFIFSSNKLQIQSKVKPKCGRIVAFSAGEENLHGVLPVLSGRRCAMALWFTHDLRYMELNRYKAQKILSNMKEEMNRKTEL